MPCKGGSEDDQAYYRGHTSAQPKVCRAENMENPRKVAAIASEEGVPSASEFSAEEFEKERERKRVWCLENLDQCYYV